jgi:thiol-disulfide isomerase/thioredoxin
MNPLKHACAVALFLCCIASVKAQDGKQYVIEGHVTGLIGKVLLISYKDYKNPWKDSMLVTDGSFRFTGAVSAPDVYTIRFDEKKKAKPIFLENTMMHISGHVDSLDVLRFEGSSLQKQYQQWMQTWQLITAKAGTIYRKSDAAEKEADTTKKVQLKKEVAASFDSLDKQLYAAVGAFVQQYPASPVAAYIIYERFVSYSYPDYAAAQYAKLAPVAQQSSYGKLIAKSQADAAKTAIGSRPSFTQADTLGKPVQLASFKGKYVLVDFWASWCGPCRKENPNVVAAYRKYHEKGFEIIGVSLDDKKEPWLNAIHKDGLAWTHVSDLKGWQNEVALEYAVKSVPTSFLVGPDGKIIGKNLRGEALQQELEKLLGSK